MYNAFGYGGQRQYGYGQYGQQYPQQQYQARPQQQYHAGRQQFRPFVPTLRHGGYQPSTMMYRNPYQQPYYPTYAAQQPAYQTPAVAPVQAATADLEPTYEFQGVTHYLHPDGIYRQAPPTSDNEQQKIAQRRGKSILVLGSGMCSPPLVEYLCNCGFNVTIGTRTVARAQPLIEGRANARAVAVDMEAEGVDALLNQLISEADLTISMLPYLFHVQAAKIAIQHKKHFCTTSYISDEMKALDGEAKAAGIVLLNECGVDPGTDHMNAMRIIDQARLDGAQVDMCSVYAGGLPAPDNTNPMGYKLSWAPRGVLLASRNPAHFLRDGEVVDVPGEELFSPSNFFHVKLDGIDATFEAYPNRDSEKYVEVYKIPEVKTMMRGSYRNLGFCQYMYQMRALGFLELDERPDYVGKSFAEATCDILGAAVEEGADVSTIAKAAFVEKSGLAADHDVVYRMEWLGMFSGNIVPAAGKTALDVLNCCWENEMQYGEGEKDMIAMEIAAELTYPDGRREKVTSTIIDIGQQPGHSSMSRTVGLPMAIGARMILDGEFVEAGVHRPNIPELYNPILDELKEKHDVNFVVKRTPL